jgi:conjugal transfer pilus assembly protein TraK
MKQPVVRSDHSRAIVLSTALFVLLASHSLSETCGPEGCAAPVPSFYGQGASERSGQAPVVRSQYGKLPPGPPAKSQVRATTVPQEARKSTPTPPARKTDNDAPLLTGFADSAPSQEEVLYGSTQRISPEGASQVFLSSSDINRIICPVEIKDAIYSKEKGLTVKLADNNAFVKWLVVKKEGKDLYATTPSELYIVCGQNVYTLIAVPKRIPAQTVQLSSGKADAIKSNLALFQEVPFEKKILTLIKRIYTDNLPDSFTVERVNKAYPVFQGLSLTLHSIVTIEGEGLRVKEYRAHIEDDAKQDTFLLKEKDFLATDLASRPVAISIDVLKLTKGATSRIFVVERTEGGTL